MRLPVWDYPSIGLGLKAVADGTPYGKAKVPAIKPNYGTFGNIVKSYFWGSLRGTLNRSNFCPATSQTVPYVSRKSCPEPPKMPQIGVPGRPVSGWTAAFSQLGHSSGVNC